MCGLSGCAGEVSVKEERIFKKLLWISAWRGMDATGAASVARTIFGQDRRREIKLAKETGGPQGLFDRKSFDQLFYGNNCVYLGHNRSKTVGASNRQNAHPFRFEDVVGAHNGTLDNENRLRLDPKREFDTDSEAIISSIQKFGIEDTIGKIEDTEAYALTWYDARDHTLNFIRNDKRPLLFCYANKHKTLYWGSEWALIAPCLHSEDVKPDDKYWVVTPNLHYKFQIPDFAKAEFQPPDRTRLKNFVPVYAMGPKRVFPHTSFKGHQQDFDYSSVYGGYAGYSLRDDNDFSDLYDDKGNYLGNKKKDPVQEKAKEVLNSIADAKDALSDVSGLTDQFDVSDETESAILISAEDFLKKRAFDKLKGTNLMPKDTLDNRKRYSSKDLHVWRDKISGTWEWLEWDKNKKEFSHHMGPVHPKGMPFNILDISDHRFKHKGSGQQKTISYKGFKKDLLQRERFELLMKSGCDNCDRVPEWGNEVTFFSKEHDFLCEYCVETPGLVEASLEQARNRNKVA